MISWLLLTYKMAAEPSARRVYIWRKLKRLGAITIFEAVWVLPESPRTHDQFQWLAAEIQEMGGEAMFWKAQAELSGQEDELIQLFSRQVDKAYQELLVKMEQPDADSGKLSQLYQQIRQRYYFQSTLGQQVRERLLAVREGETS
jgi:hypothetical protein